MFAGSLLHQFEPWLKCRPKISLLFVGLAIIGGAMDYSAYYAWVPPIFGHERIVMHTIGGVLLVAGVLGNKEIGFFFAGRLPTFLGKISFSTYLLHWPLICSLGFGLSYFLQVNGVNHQKASFIVIFVILLVVFSASWSFVRWVEYPAIMVANKVSDFFLNASPDKLAKKPREP